MNVYATLDELRRMLGLTAEQTADDDLLLALLESASRLVDGYTGRRFYPLHAARAYPVTHPARLLLDDDLLTLHALTNGDGSAIASDLIHLHPAGCAVKSSLVLDRARAAFTHRGDPLDALTVEATWGYHPAWPDAWDRAASSVQGEPLTPETTLLIVSNAGDYAQGCLLRIGDELIHVRAVNPPAFMLTVARGANGTAPAAHALGAPVDRYRPPADVRQVCLRVAAWLYRQKDAGFVYATGGLRGQVVVPPALPDDVQQALAPYVRLRVA